MNAAPVRTDQVVRRQLVCHTRHEVIRVPLSGDARLDALLKRLASRGGFVIEERVPDEEGA